MSKAIKTLVMAITLMSLVLASGSDPLTAAEENPCKADFQKLCGDVKPGEGRIQACLKEHKDDISQECRAFLEAKGKEIREKIEQISEACKSDAQKLCPGIEPGEGRILKCLMQHQEEVSDQCKNSFKK